MAQLLILKKDTPSNNRGTIAEIRASGTPFGGDEVLSYVLVEIPAPISLVNQYDNPVIRQINYEILDHNIPLDRYQVRMTATDNASQTLGITREQVESFLNKWSANITSVGINSVEFTVALENVFQSEGFWDVPIGGVIFEDNYNGVDHHHLTINYSAIGNSPTYMERYVMGKGGLIVSHENKIIVCEFESTDAFSVFKEAVDLRFNQIILKKRYYVSNAVVDAIVSNGGVMSVPNSVALSYIKDKLDD